VAKPDRAGRAQPVPRTVGRLNVGLLKRINFMFFCFGVILYLLDLFARIDRWRVWGLTAPRCCGHTDEHGCANMNLRDADSGISHSSMPSSPPGAKMVAYTGQPYAF